MIISYSSQHLTSRHFADKYSANCLTCTGWSKSGILSKYVNIHNHREEITFLARKKQLVYIGRPQNYNINNNNNII